MDSSDVDITQLRADLDDAMLAIAALECCSPASPNTVLAFDDTYTGPLNSNQGFRNSVYNGLRFNNMIVVNSFQYDGNGGNQDVPPRDRWLNSGYYYGNKSGNYVVGTDHAGGNPGRIASVQSVTGPFDVKSFYGTPVWRNGMTLTVTAFGTRSGTPNQLVGTYTTVLGDPRPVGCVWIAGVSLNPPLPPTFHDLENVPGQDFTNIDKLVIETSGGSGCDWNDDNIAIDDMVVTF